MKSNIGSVFISNLCVLLLYFTCTAVPAIEGRRGRFLNVLCKRSFFHRRIERCKELFPCDGDNAIRSASDLQTAIENAPPYRQGYPITTINVCSEYISVPATFVVKPASRNNGIEFDKFGFKISFQNMKLQCRASTSIDLNGRCILDASDQGTSIFYLNNATLDVNGFHLMNGGSIDHTAGGAVFMTNSSTLLINNVAFSNNTAIRGGVIFSNNTESLEPNRIVIGDPSAFTSTKNRASSLINNENRFSLRSPIQGRQEDVNNEYNIDFLQNKAKSGGAIYSSNTIVSGSNVRFVQNEASQFGGALDLHRKSSAALSNVMFYNNYAAGDGGAIHTTTTTNSDGDDDDDDEDDDNFGGLVTLDRIVFVQNAARNHVRLTMLKCLLSETSNYFMSGKEANFFLFVLWVFCVKLVIFFLLRVRQLT